MSKLHTDLEVLVTPLDPAKDRLDGSYPTIHFIEQIPKLLVSQADYDRVQALLGTDPSGRRITMSPAEDGVRIRIRLVSS